MSTYSYTLEHPEGGTRILLSGDITEDSDFSPLVPLCQGDVVLDLDQIHRINSCGVREWVQFVSALDGAKVPFRLERCSVAMVTQMNQISNFKGGGVVVSIRAPFFCESCKAERHELFELNIAQREEMCRDRPCPQCRGQMSFDDLPESYLAFLA